MEKKKKKKVGQKHYKKRITAFHVAHFLKQKKKKFCISFLANVCETNLFFFFSSTNGVKDLFEIIMVLWKIDNMLLF